MLASLGVPYVPGRLGEEPVVGAELFDCPWCGSAKSIEHGLCQVCLMEFDVETKIIQLPPRRTLHGHPAGSRLEHGPTAGRPPGA